MRHPTRVAALTVVTPWFVVAAAACTGTIGVGGNPLASQGNSATSGATGAAGSGPAGGGGSVSGVSGTTASAPEGGAGAPTDFACTSTSPDPGPTSILLLT